MVVWSVAPFLYYCSVHWCSIQSLQLTNILNYKTDRTVNGKTSWWKSKSLSRTRVICINPAKVRQSSSSSFTAVASQHLSQVINTKSLVQIRYIRPRNSSSSAHLRTRGDTHLNISAITVTTIDHRCWIHFKHPAWSLKCPPSNSSPLNSRSNGH